VHYVCFTILIFSLHFQLWVRQGQYVSELNTLTISLLLTENLFAFSSLFSVLMVWCFLFVRIEAARHVATKRAQPNPLSLKSHKNKTIPSRQQDYKVSWTQRMALLQHSVPSDRRSMRHDSDFHINEQPASLMTLQTWQNSGEKSFCPQKNNTHSDTLHTYKIALVFVTALLHVFATTRSHLQGVTPFKDTYIYIFIYLHIYSTTTNAHWYNMLYQSL
jgi:hypothetical protein